MQREPALFRTGLIASALLWLAMSSDWSLRGTWSDLVATIGLTGAGLWISLAKAQSRRVRLAWLPAVLPGLLLLLIAPLSSLGLFFWKDQVLSEHVRQVSAQPGGPWTARVAVRDDGYIGGGAQVKLRLQHDWLPFLEHDVTGGESVYPYGRDKPLRTVATWRDDGRIDFHGARSGSGTFEPGGVRWHLPTFLAAPASLVAFLIQP